MTIWIALMAGIFVGYLMGNKEARRKFFIWLNSLGGKKQEEPKDKEDGK